MTGITRSPWSQTDRRWRRLLRPAWPAILRRTRPLSEVWGFDRGTPVDRHYIEAFLSGHRADIRGRVLEVQDSVYTDRFGSGVEAKDVLDVDPGNPRATIVADLSRPETLPESVFDCFILTQTLHLIYDLREAVRGCHRLLRPGGVLLVTGPAVSRFRGGADFWRFTPASLERLLEETFGEATVRAYGNVLAANAFLSGMAEEEVPSRLLDEQDEHFPVIVAGRAVKA